MGHLDTLPECKKPELKLVIWPDECLKYAVAPFPEEYLGSIVARNTAGRMIRAMYRHHGVGLAAQQVAVPFQIFTMDAYWTQPDKSKHPRVFLNPQITGVGDWTTALPHPGEGCLSFPYDFKSPVRRHDQVELEWLDFKGKVHHEWFEGYEAIIVQHEMDHLTGHCFIDRLSQLKQGIAYRRARKMRRRYFSGMKQGLKMFKAMQKGPEALADRNNHFEMLRRKKLTEEAQKLGEYDEECNRTSGHSEVVDPRPSSRYAAGARRLVQREDARRNDKRVQLPVHSEGQEGDERTESSGDAESGQR